MAATGIQLWGAAPRRAPLGLYCVGLMGTVLGLRLFDVSGGAFTRSVGLVAAGFFVAASAAAYLGRRMEGDVWRQLRLPSFADLTPQPWFVPAQACIGAFVLCLASWMAVDQNLTTLGRAAGAGLTAILTVGLVLLAQSRRATLGELSFRQGCQLACLAGTLALGQLGWAMISPTNRSADWLLLHRGVTTLLALAIATRVCGSLVPRPAWRDPAWADASRQVGGWFGIAALVVLAGVLAGEAWWYDGAGKVGRTLVAMKLLPEALATRSPETLEPMATWAVLVVVAAMLGLIVAAFRFAIQTSADPFGLDERGRVAYVYAAEILMLLVFVHLKLTRDAWFRGAFFVQFWPFILMTVAFVGVGLSEWFRRRGPKVLAEPLERTGVFLPMLPVLAFWVMPASSYSMVWFLAGFLYGILAIRQRSFAFAATSALAVNVGLWVVLANAGVSFWQHPQVWLIPPALVVLAAEHLNRRRLSEAQSRGLRYLALMIIYVSSTADMFIAGLGQSLVLPIVLTLLCLVGILAGMMLRVRAFVLLGVSFLLVVVLSMIWHAGVGLKQTWILYAFGIALGMAMLALFGIFEKRRADLLAALDKLKQWQ
jgi:hypothetical protein